MDGVRRNGGGGPTAVKVGFAPVLGRSPLVSNELRTRTLSPACRCYEKTKTHVSVVVMHVINAASIRRYEAIITYCGLMFFLSKPQIECFGPQQHTGPALQHVQAEHRLQRVHHNRHPAQGRLAGDIPEQRGFGTKFDGHGGAAIDLAACLQLHF
jgi:hypothetical protein